MKHLSGSLSDNKEVPEENPDEVRYKEDENLEVRVDRCVGQ